MDGRRRALIVANDEYEHDGLRHLRSAAADAGALASVLGDPRIGGFEVQVARNQPAHDVGARVEDLFSEGEPDEVILLHFSCHGLKDESGELFFATRNTRPNRLGSTAVSANFVQRCMRASRSRSIILLLDCCYGGAFSQGVTVRAAGDVNLLDSFPGGRLGGGRGRAVITASSSIEYAFEGDQLADDHAPRPSVFTAALVEGLATGDADRDEDGWISLNELYDYVFDKVRERNPHQTPSRDVEMQGELYLARSRRQRIRPLAVPADLQAAMTDPNMFTRLGAASELRSRVSGDNLPAAVGAHAALTEMAGTDIRYVAEAAQAALREVAVRTQEPELHFGQVAKDCGPVHRAVHLLGPPIARACRFEASHRWIRVEETTDGLDVCVDTSQTGDLRGTITLKGPTGEAVIPVRAEVTPTVQAALKPADTAQPADTAEPEPEPLPGLPAEPARPAEAPPTSPRRPAPDRTRPLALVGRHLRRILLPRTGRARAILAGLVVVLLAGVTTATVMSLDRSDDSGSSSGSSVPAVNSVAFSPDGKLIATAGDDGTVRLWNPATRAPIGVPLTGHTDRVTSVAFSPDGKTLASASYDNTVRLWNPVTGQQLSAPLTGHDSSVLGVAFSPDGKTLASASYDNTIRLWSPVTGQPIGEPLTGHDSTVTSVAFGPDGKTLASGSEDGTVRLWNTAMNAPVGQPLTGHGDDVRSVAFSPDGKTLASGSDDHTVRLWNTTTGQPIATPLTGHTSTVTSVTFAPDGRTLASASYYEVRLWNPATGQPIHAPLTEQSGVTSVVFSPDGRTLAGAGNYNTVQLWNPTTGRLIGTLSQPAPASATAPATPAPTTTGS